MANLRIRTRQKEPADYADPPRGCQFAAAAVRRDKPAGPRTTKRAGTRAGPCTEKTRLLYRHDVLRERPRFVVGDGPVGRHGNGAPHPGRSLFDLLREISLGVLAR